ncbi:hypothetical protein C6A85_87975 [Mycobacterium sp. ITM-2017-0098]|nr:hypothetical protein C6A85_87975 [Mycobacterium sp. ITM-2017-0098]
MPDQHAPEDDVPTRGLFSARTSAFSIVAASIATLGVVFVMFNGNDDSADVQSVPAQPNTVLQLVPTPVSAPPEPAPPQPQPPALTMDSRGFVDSTARCDSSQRAVAIARTERSAIVVCQGPDGAYEYQGMRLRDGASLQLDDVRPIAAGFEARNDGTTYRLSPTELVVISGESLQSRDAIVEYRAG